MHCTIIYIISLMLPHDSAIITVCVVYINSRSFCLLKCTAYDRTSKVHSKENYVKLYCEGWLIEWQIFGVCSISAIVHLSIYLQFRTMRWCMFWYFISFDSSYTICGVKSHRWICALEKQIKPIGFNEAEVCNGCVYLFSRLKNM